MNNSENFNLKIYEGTDLFNPLTVENANTSAIDEQMFLNQNAGIQVATELVTGTVHAITRNVPDANVFRFTAVSRFTAGDTFTVDGVQVSALTTSGEQIPDGAYIIGSEVMGLLKGTLLTLYVSMAKPAHAADADKLGGIAADGYATSDDLAEVREVADGAGELATQLQDDVRELTQNLAGLFATQKFSGSLTIKSGQAPSFATNVYKEGYTAIAFSSVDCGHQNLSVVSFGFSGNNAYLYVRNNASLETSTTASFTILYAKNL